MKFLIQTIGGQIRHDFSFTLLESINFQNWLHPDNPMTYSFIPFEELDHISGPWNVIPIGSVEFVTKFLENCYGLTPKPKNIPAELMTQRNLHRKVINGTEKDIVGKKFVKSNDKIKSFTEICSEAPPGNYQISDVIEIASEWRAFIYNRKLVGLQNYTGDFTMFPSINAINGMIDDYSIFNPIAYTLDVGIMVPHEQTIIIEVHDFFSCGLYGFSDHNILPFMFSNWFYEFIKKENG